RLILPGSIAISPCEVPAAVLCFATRSPGDQPIRPSRALGSPAQSPPRQPAPPSRTSESPHRFMGAKRVWRAALGELQVTPSPANFETWLRDTALVEVDDTRFRISVPNGFAKDWLETRYRSLISQTLGRIVGYGVQVDFVVGPLEAGGDGAQGEAEDSAGDARGGDAGDGVAAQAAPAGVGVMARAPEASRATAATMQVRVEPGRVGGEGGATN